MSDYVFTNEYGDRIGFSVLCVCRASLSVGKYVASGPAGRAWSPTGSVMV